jgi:hypothetical protein
MDTNILKGCFPESVSGRKENAARGQQKQQEEFKILKACDVMELKLGHHFQLI